MLFPLCGGIREEALLLVSQRYAALAGIGDPEVNQGFHAIWDFVERVGSGEELLWTAQW